MNEDFQKNVAAAFAAAQSTVLNDLGALSGINPAYAQAYPALLGGFMAAKATGGGQATPLDTYAMGVIAGLAALVTTDPRQAAACFEDIAAWAGGGAAHCRTALEAEKRAQDRKEAADRELGPLPPAPAAGDDPMAFRQAGMASPALGSGAPQSGVTTVAQKLRDAANAAPGYDPLPADHPFKAPMPQAVPQHVLDATQAAVDDELRRGVPQDPRERAADAYDASADEAADPKI